MTTMLARGPRVTRRHAFEKLAALSAHDNGGREPSADLLRLCELYGPSTGPDRAELPAPMDTRELEVLISLSRAASLVQRADHAERLLCQIGPYLVDCTRQTFIDSPCLRTFQLSPWQVLAYDVTSAILAIGTRHPTCHGLAETCIRQTIEGFVRIARNISDWDERSAVDHTAIAARFAITCSAFLSALSDRAGTFSLSTSTQSIDRLRRAISTDFALKFDTILTSPRAPRSGPWKRLIRVYDSHNLPLGSLLLSNVLIRYTACAVMACVPHAHSLEALMDRPIDLDDDQSVQRVDMSDDLTTLTDIITEAMKLDGDSNLTLSGRAHGLTAYMACLLLDEDVADPEMFMSLLEAIVVGETQPIDDTLTQTALKCMTVLAQTRLGFASIMTRLLPKLIVQRAMQSETAAVAAECLARALLQLPQDMRISTLYSLGNVLSVGGDVTRTQDVFMLLDTVVPAQACQDSMSIHDTETAVPGHVVQAIAKIAVRCNDEKITALALSMLIQKLGGSLATTDLKIIECSAELGSKASTNDLRALLKTYARMNSHALVNRNTAVLQTIMNARMELARDIRKDSPMYEIYVTHLLDSIVSTTGAVQSDTRSIQNGVLGSEGIVQILHPLAVLLSQEPDKHPVLENPTVLLNLSRDAWFNLVAHDCLLNSAMMKRYAAELEVFAMFSPSLIDNDRVNGRESGIDLNTVLRRNNNPAHAAQQKQALLKAFPAHEGDIRSLDYSELTFLNATHLIAILRANTGDCTITMDYFLDPKFKRGALSNVLLAVALSAIDAYLNRTSSGKLQEFSAPNLAQQLVKLFQYCCHRVAKIQQVAIAAVDRITRLVPSALCQHTSLFAMLELLTLMWSSCLEADTHEYEWKSSYSSTKANVRVQLSDDYGFRRQTLATFHTKCKGWVKHVMNVAPLDMSGLLQTYLSHHEDDGAYGHLALGRSFALEMGCEIPSTDHKLTSIEDQGHLSINAASDFIAQYTKRQGYRIGEDVSRGLASTLKSIMTRIRSKQQVPELEAKTALRRAAASLCGAKTDSYALVNYIVGIPFLQLTKGSIKFGISLWMGILKENPRLEASMLCEIAAQWELSVRNKRGIFNTLLQHPDPFYLKQKFAPSDKEALVRRQQLVHDLIAPHLRIVQFLSSHYNATRLCSSSLDRVFFRLARVTTNAIRKSAAQPLAREMHFHIVLLTLQILACSTGASHDARWALKDQILSVGLLWFTLSPRWSYGGSRLQVKAEVKLMQDVMGSLQHIAVTSIGAVPTAPHVSLRRKQELLLFLLKSESNRLAVWLSPLNDHPFDLPRPTEDESHDDSDLVSAAWKEDASLAIQLFKRFPTSDLGSKIRQNVLMQPERALDDPDGLQLLLNVTSDIEDHLKYLLYWCPVNPMTAVTLVMPEYGHHPFIVQYAMRALESHSVDVTFFYVPQIVQTLRFDVLGYLEQYVIETARFSQLFAHQIIWNMKANAYKDEDSIVPDSIKPVLDRVLNSLTTSFSADDKDFYEREFAFFDQVTSISGKLRPYIKRPKPEKKQKIEEELRKIQVDVGVYLPSNPDGVVIGIDRQSGKPLQSHAKAPFMATFRIRKERGQDMKQVDKSLDRSAKGQDPKHDATTYEVWQSAIFKVGDDCRQDVLALQMIAAFRGIFNNVGLNVYVFPYRVTATAPGCGVIDVLPNSISRDMLGREQVNGLYEYFVSKYGNEDSLRFQAARHNFVRSMAAYSVISYLLQFKDRHNGNIMLDDAGHVLHIDFGFCFDIAPGGVKFERAPFKLTAEMVAVMGGSTTSQAYLWFEELCVKAFLASRPYAEKLSHMVTVMLSSGLPCFKPETLKNFRDRFVLEKSEREAAEYMRMLIRKSESSLSTVGYDQFQYYTNSIPYQGRI